MEPVNGDLLANRGASIWFLSLHKHCSHVKEYSSRGSTGILQWNILWTRGLWKAAKISTTAKLNGYNPFPNPSRRANLAERRNRFLVPKLALMLIKYPTPTYIALHYRPTLVSGEEGKHIDSCNEVEITKQSKFGAQDEGNNLTYRNWKPPIRWSSHSSSDTWR